MQLEACIETLQEAVLARKYKCKRIEVCSALDLGGLTPTYSLINACSKLSDIESHILIRPRAGNFVYTSDELKLMKEDIRFAAEAGANGVVFGCLTSKHTIDLKASKSVLDYAKNLHLQATFHRAIDFTTTYLNSIQLLVDLGFDRVLTSGQKPTALEGIETIKSAVQKFSGQIELMAGSGINAKNAKRFQSIPIDAIHFTIRKKSTLNTNFTMGFNYQPDEIKLDDIIKTINIHENY